MSTDDIMLVRIRLNEADIVIGNAVVDRSDSTANGDLIPTIVDVHLILDVFNSRRTKPPFDQCYSGPSKCQHRQQ